MSANLDKPNRKQIKFLESVLFGFGLSKVVPYHSNSCIFWQEFVKVRYFGKIYLDNSLKVKAIENIRLFMK